MLSSVKVCCVIFVEKNEHESLSNLNNRRLVQRSQLNISNNLGFLVDLNSTRDVMFLFDWKTKRVDLSWIDLTGAGASDINVCDL